MQDCSPVGGEVKPVKLYGSGFKALVFEFRCAGLFPSNEVVILLALGRAGPRRNREDCLEDLGLGILKIDNAATCNEEHINAVLGFNTFRRLGQVAFE